MSAISTYATYRVAFGADIFIEAFETGSRYICDPPVMNTDDDIIVLVRDLAEVTGILEDGGFRMGRPDAPGSEGMIDDHWLSFRRDNPTWSPELRAVVPNNENFIITDNIAYFNRFVLATKVSKKLNLLNKEDRIVMFDTILNMPYPNAAPTEEVAPVQEEPVQLNHTLDAAQFVRPRFVTTNWTATFGGDGGRGMGA